MPRGLYNWTFKDIVNFLRNNNFKYTHTEGSHFYYFKKTVNKDYLVQVPFHGNKSVKPKTLKGIIKQSGISKVKWLNK